MDAGTAMALNRLTRDFYEHSAAGFCALHELPAPGWCRVLRVLQRPFARLPTLSVLDVGCGGGRLFDCLTEELDRPFEYLGLDASAHLIGLASARRVEDSNATVRVADLVNGDLETELGARKFSLVAAFGVLHHIPGAQQRRDFLAALCHRVAPGGALALSTWRRRSDNRFQRKLVDLSTFDRETDRPLDLSQLEEGDHLVKKPGRGVRYCHFVHEKEAQELFQGLPLSLRSDFTADGRVGHRNRYFVLS